MMEIGRVIGTEKRPNTAYTFYFWADPRQSVGIGTIVRVESEPQVFGVVVEAMGFNDLESPLHEFLSVGGDAAIEPPTLRPEMRVYQAAVLRRVPEEPVGAVPIGRVFLANEADVQMALRTDGYAEDFGIPCGCYGSEESPVAVHLHSDFLLGPEAGHLNITGTSGLAAKTSFILFLLQSIFQHHKSRDEGIGGEGVAALLFNTKGGDLLYIDQEPEEDGFTDLDRRLYEACGVRSGPFKSVRYYAPLDKDGYNLNSLRRNAELDEIDPTRRFSFGLKEVIKHAEVLLNRDDLDAKADAYLQYLNQRFVEGEGHSIGNDGERYKASSLSELVDIVQRQIRWCEQNNQSQIDSHNALTVRKMYNRINNLGVRFAGLIAEEGRAEGPFDESFEPGTVYVVDVSQLSSEAQDLVFAAAITRLRERMELQELGVGRLIVMVDEMNKYAPSGGAETYVVKALREIAARGRYLGLTLFGAQQFRSRVDKEIVGNAATHAFGHVEAEELSQPGYSYFTPAVKEKLGAMKPGEALLKHPHFAQPVFVRFPRPAVLKGQDGLRRFRPAKERPIEDLILAEVRRVGGTLAEARDELALLSRDGDNLIKVLRSLRRLEQGQNPLPVLKRAQRPAGFLPREPVAVIGDDPDPFA
jgi:uncharacterized protein